LSNPDFFAREKTSIITECFQISEIGFSRAIKESEKFLIGERV
jgi:hypothetical protein